MIQPILKPQNLQNAAHRKYQDRSQVPSVGEGFFQDNEKQVASQPLHCSPSTRGPGGGKESERNSTKADGSGIGSCSGYSEGRIRARTANRIRRKAEEITQEKARRRGRNPKLKPNNQSK